MSINKNSSKISVNYQTFKEIVHYTQNITQTVDNQFYINVAIISEDTMFFITD